MTLAFNLLERRRNERECLQFSKERKKAKGRKALTFEPSKSKGC